MRRGRSSTRRRPGRSRPSPSTPPATRSAPSCPTASTTLFVISQLAEHTRNLLGDPRASLLVTERHVEGTDPLAAVVSGPDATITCDINVAGVRQYGDQTGAVTL